MAAIKTSHRIIGFSILTIIVLLFTAWLLTVFNSNFLSVNNPCKAKILVIEGWLPTFCIERIVKNKYLEAYDTIIITGTTLEYPEDKINKLKSGTAPDHPTELVFYENGTLYFSNTAIALVKHLKTITNIAITGHGTKSDNTNAHFTVAINDSIMGGGFMEENRCSHNFSCKLDASAIKNITLCFDNDLVSDGEDRSIIIDGITINNNDIPLTALNYLPDSELGQYSSNRPFKSVSARTAAYLHALKINVPFILLDTAFMGRNRTVATARKFNKWLIKNHIHENINIISMDGHSRRTYVAYKYALGGRNKIGIISLEDYNYINAGNHIRISNMVGEYFSLLITYIEFAVFR